MVIHKYHNRQLTLKKIERKYVKKEKNDAFYTCTPVALGKKTSNYLFVPELSEVVIGALDRNFVVSLYGHTSRHELAVYIGKDSWQLTSLKINYC